MSKKIYRPKKGNDVPDAPRYDAETGEPVNVDKRKALASWLSESKKSNKADDESYQVTIDPKQAFYAKKQRKE